jgi:hypothetical protein
VLWHFGFHQTPNAPERLIAGREAVYFREVFLNRRRAIASRCTFTADADGVARDYDGHSERAFTSSLRRCTICLVRRMSPSLTPAPKLDAIARKRAFNSL